jgi:hypothetical protein
VSPARQVAAFIRPVLAAAVMAAAVLAVGHWLADYGAVKRLVAEVATGVLTYAAALAMIDRPTLRLLRSFAVDLRQLRAST